MRKAGIFLENSEHAAKAGFFTSVPAARQAYGRLKTKAKKAEKLEDRDEPLIDIFRGMSPSSGWQPVRYQLDGKGQKPVSAWISPAWSWETSKEWPVQILGPIKPLPIKSLKTAEKVPA